MCVDVIVVFATKGEDAFHKGDGGRRSAFLPRGRAFLGGVGASRDTKPPGLGSVNAQSKRLWSLYVVVDISETLVYEIILPNSMFNY
jgi:hypothetical protein